ncbi:hypothetical protein [Arenimonas oryziterrae]|uniref:hypothetical protein n=1 Tax=Arenimonas oryziterrae TaxID=498055 RepID=UPI0012DC21E8|nr:hypothetical protein [Arenimonas oryziterrae]
MSGSANVPVCEREGPGCRSATEVLYEYTQAQPDDPLTFGIALQSSPWRMYGADLRILTVAELAGMLRPQLEPKHKRVELHGSWTGVAPSTTTPSLATQLSRQLKGFPVTGMDGFLWMDSKGGMRTTRQAFTVRRGAGRYFVPTGKEVLVPLTVGWAAGLEDRFGPEDAEMMLLAGVGNDVFLLCPDGALADFEAGAKMGSAIAAYNAAQVRLSRNQAGDRAAALALLERAKALGDAKAAAQLQGLRRVPAKK